MKWAAVTLFLLFLALSAWFMALPGKPKDRTNTICLTNLKQVATAIAIYQSDYDDRSPLRDTWMDAIHPYSKNDYILHCPVLQLPKANASLYGYCFNANLSGAKYPANPEKYKMVFESINQGRNASGFVTSVPKPGRHRNGNAIAYADTHVKFERP